MDTNPPSALPAEYVGLKEELQKIAAIIEQYPDQLKQRAFELLINAYLGRTHSAAAPAPTETAAPEAAAAEGDASAGGDDAVLLATEEPVAEDARAETLSTESGEAMNGDENYSLPVNGENGSELEPDSRITANLADSTNKLRKRIRLRTMSQMPWHQSS